MGLLGMPAGISQGKEISDYTNMTGDLKKMVQQLGMQQIRQLMLQIEDGLESSDNGTIVTGPERPSSKSESSLSDFGRELIKNLWTSRAQKQASKACFVSRLKKETNKVVNDVLEEEDNIRCVAGGLSVVAHIMEELKKTSSKGREYRHSLLYMLGLLKHMNQQVAWELTKQKRTAVVQFIVFGSLLFNIQLQHKNLYCCGAELNVADTQNLELGLGYAHNDLAFGSITKKIFPTAARQSQTRRKNEVGITEARDQVVKLLDMASDDKSSRAIVIEGPDGIGKTTLSNSVLDRLDLTTYKICRLDIQQDISESKIRTLQQQILHDLFRKDIALKSYVEGRAHLSNAFREEACRPVFIFVDNAHFDLAQLLPTEEQWLPRQSRILVTTTDRSMCSIPTYIKQFHYNVKPLPDSEAENLILQKVSVRGQAMDSLRRKSDGIPLALIMLSSYLRQQIGSVSAHCLLFINQSSGDVFQICSSIIDFSYSCLDKDYKEAFLDIAIFFNNRDRLLVSYIFPEVKLNKLEEIGLIKISEEDRLSIHGVVTKWAIQMSEKHRITNMESYNDVRVRQELSKVEGIWLSEGELDAADLDQMHTSLRILYLGKSTKVKGECKNKFQNLRFFSPCNKDCLALGLGDFTRVTYFRGRLKNDDYFDELNKLWGILKTTGVSNLSRLTTQIQLAKSLHVLDLSDSKDIIELPKGFTCLYSLEDLNLSNCIKLKNLPESIGELKSLYRLSLKGCSKLKELRQTICDLSWLGELDCTNCSEIKALPNNFGQLSSLCHLDLNGCSQLVSLPDSFGNLSSLQYLDLSHCTQLSMLPNTFHKLSSLSLLRITYSSLDKLPENFGNLSSLKELDLSDAQKLKCLHDLSSSTNKDPQDDQKPDGQNPESPANSYYFNNMDSVAGQKLVNPAALLSLENIDSPGGKMFENPANLLLWKRMFSAGGKYFERHCNLISIKKRDLSADQKQAVKGSFGNLQKLCRLCLKDCAQLNSLSEDFSRLSDLEELDLTGCDKLESLPKYFGYFKSLLVLKLSCSKLTQLPHYIGFMISLQRMTLTNCASFSRLPFSICDLKSLSYLHLGGCSMLTELPNDFGKLSSLEELEITGCTKLKSIGNEQPQSLRVLKLRDSSLLNGLPENIGKLSKLEELVLIGCETLESLPSSLGQIQSLRHLTLRGASKLTSLPEIMSTSIETLDLRGCSNLRMPRQGMEFYSSLKLLFIDGCPELCCLPDDFGQLNSLRYLSIAGCTGLNGLPYSLKHMVNLVAIDASNCPRLPKETMDRLAELRSLYFVDVRGSQLLIEQWKERKQLQHQLLVRSQMKEEAIYADTIISCLFQHRRELHKEARFPHSVISSSFFWTSVTRTERFALVVTCSPDSGESEVVKKKRNKLQEEGFHICYIDMNDRSETYSNMKSRHLLCFTMLRLLEKQHSETLAAVKILHTWILTLDVCTGKEGEQQIKNIRAIEDGDLQPLIDIHGGVGRFFPPLLHTVAAKFEQNDQNVMSNGFISSYSDAGASRYSRHFTD